MLRNTSETNNDRHTTRGRNPTGRTGTHENQDRPRDGNVGVRMNDIQFQNELRELLDDDVEDEQIVKYVLEHAWNQWPHSFEQWLHKKRRYGGFD